MHDDNTIHNLLDLPDLKCDICTTEQAVDYLTQYFGYKLNEVEYQSTHTLQIPICQECIDTISGGKWTLFYCTGCCKSGWRNREDGKYKGVVLVKYCFECYGKEMLDKAR